MVIGGSSKGKETKTKNKRPRPVNDTNTLPNRRPCHQCRQTRNGLNLTCKNQNGDKPCVLNFCEKCILKSYGDNAKEIALLDDWTCPRCSDLCLCKTCRKNRGEKEHVARIALSAKSVGFGLVSETTNRVKRKKPIVALNKEIRVSPRTQRMNSSSGPIHNANTSTNTIMKLSNPAPEVIVIIDDEKIAKKPKMEGLEELRKDNEDDIINDVSPDQNSSDNRPNVSEQLVIEEDIMEMDEIEPAKLASNEALSCPLTPIEDIIIEENRDIYEKTSPCVEQQTDTDAVEIEIPDQPKGNVFQRSVLRFFRWFIGSA